MINLLNSQFSAITYALSWTIVDSLWQFLLVGVVVGLLIWRIPNAQSNLRYHISLASLVLCAGLWLSNLSYHFSAFQGHSTSVEIENTLVQKQKTKPKASNYPMIIPESQGFEPTSEIRPTTKRSSFEVVLTKFIGDYKTELAVLWLIGVLVLFLRLLGSWLFLKKLRNEDLQLIEQHFIKRLQTLQQQLNIAKSIQLASSPFVKTPMTFGHLKPIILLPIGLINQLSTEEVEAILLHELAHIKRNDFIANVFQNCLNILLFYHPVIWWLNKRINTIREECCDDLVINQKMDKHLYAKTLLQVQKYSLTIKNTLVMTATNKKSSLTQRVHRLFHNSRPEKHRSFSLPLVVVFLLLSSLTLFAFQIARQQPTVSIAVDKMNIFYYGIENPITVAVEGTMNNELKVFSEDAKITDLGNGKYNVFPNKVGKIMINIEGNSVKRDVEFLVKEIPTPKVSGGNIMVGVASAMTVDEVKNMKELSLESLEGFEVTCEVVSFEITRVPIGQDPYTEISSTANLTENGKVTTMLASTVSKDTYYFDNIMGKCPGDEKPRKIGSFVIKVE